MSINSIHYSFSSRIVFIERRVSMKRIDKNGKRRKLDIKYIYKSDGTKLEEILKEGYLSYLRKLKIR